mgnify:CR=1 FL=1
MVLAHYLAGDMVWVQDYHLMLLPQLLKQAHPKMKVRGAATTSPNPPGRSTAGPRSSCVGGCRRMRALATLSTIERFGTRRR